MREHSPVKRDHFAPFSSWLSKESSETVGVLYTEKCHWIPEFGPMNVWHVDISYGGDCSDFNAKTCLTGSSRVLTVCWVGLSEPGIFGFL